GDNAGPRTAHGGVLATANDFNPERVVLNNRLSAGFLPGNVSVGDHVVGAVVGIMDYNFGNYFLQTIAPVSFTSDGLARETTSAPGPDELTFGTFNVENLAPSDPQTKFDTLAGLIVHNLQAPDLLGIEEIQDNTAATDNGVAAADVTWSKLIAAIQAAGGPTYDYRQIDPVNDQDGGQPGGNIRQGFLFRTDRGVTFVDRDCGGCNRSTTPVTVVNGAQ